MSRYLILMVLIVVSCSTNLVKNPIARHIDEASPALGRLAWKMDQQQLQDEARSTETKLGIDLQRLNKQAAKDLTLKPVLTVLSAFTHDGKLASDPSYKAFIEAHKDFAILYRYALCSRTGQGSLSDECAAKGIANLMNWVKTFKPSGIPMTETDFTLVFTSADLLIDKMELADKKLLRDWIVSFIVTSDKLFASKKISDTSRVNNLNTWRLAVRAIATKLLGQQPGILANSKMLSQHAQLNLNPPANWKPDPKCTNNVNEKNYGGYDFRQRDALHYHVGNLEAWTWIALMTPDQIEPETRKSILKAFEFLRPYFVGEKTHIEFVCSTIGFDARRRDAGQEDFVEGPWKPEQAEKLLQLARAVFPEIRSWSESVVNGKFDIWRETLAAIQTIQP